jgi:uncharacterized RDD family membrane protein YckC
MDANATSAQQEVALTERAGFWRRWTAYWLIDSFIIGFIILRLLFLLIAAVVVNAQTDPVETWTLGEARPWGTVVYGCEPSIFRPVCFLYTDQDELDKANTIGTIFNIILPVTMYIYLWVGNATGRTFGKGLMGVRVVRKGTGHPLGPWRGFLRTLFYIPSAVVLLLGFLWAIWDKDKQTWHDKIAGSVVVRA